MIWQKTIASENTRLAKQTVYIVYGNHPLTAKNHTFKHNTPKYYNNNHRDFQSWNSVCGQCMGQSKAVWSGTYLKLEISNLTEEKK